MRVFDSYSTAAGAFADRDRTAGQPIGILDPAFASECCLTSKDYTLLEGHLLGFAETGPADGPMIPRLIRSKLAHARVVLTGDVDPDVATGNSRIAFSIDGLEPQQRALVHWSPDEGDVVLVGSILGATLIGMRAGQRGAVPRADGSTAEIVLHEVLFQPEAARALRARRRG
jgi:regulator of nucleoside diphosphate kinase